MLDYYLNYEVGPYTGNEPAPETDGKREMVETAAGDFAVYASEHLDGVSWIDPMLEYMRYQQVEEHSRNVLGKVKFNAKLKSIGYMPMNRGGNRGQLNFEHCKSPKLEKLGDRKRPQIWGLKKAAKERDNEIILSALVDRYYQGKL
jgi:hypothetical protein